jgi:hypothetical protein
MNPMKPSLLLSLLLATSHAIAADLPVAPKIEVNPGGETKIESRKSSSSKSESSSTGSSSSTTSTTIDGKTLTITRTTGPDGKTKVTVTTRKGDRKPKVEEMTPEEFEKKYGPKKKKNADPVAEEEEPAEADHAAEAQDEPQTPAKPGKATE